MSKTSTFTIHHDRCKPADWTPTNVLALARFISTGNLGYAAQLSRLGMQLVRSEHHEPKGGHLEEVGYARADSDVAGEYAPIDEVADDEDVTAIARIYRGPTEYCARIAIGDHEGNFEAYEHEICSTEQEALALIPTEGT